MMKKIILLIFIPFVFFGQENKHTIEWKSNFLFESNSLNKNFLNSILYGEYITDSIKNIWISSLQKNNKLYSEIINNLNYTYNFNNQSINFSFSDINILNVSFSEDLLLLGLEGNFNHQDQNMDFSNTNIRMERFQQLKINYGTTINKMKINGGASYLIGNHHLSYLIEKGNLYTAPYGAYLDIEYDMNAFVTDTSDLSLFANNGNGFSIDFSTDFSIQKYDVNLSISDLGYIIWNTSSVSLATDSSFNFHGVEVEDIFNFNDSVLETNNIADDLLNSNLTSFKSYIPATIRLSFKSATKYKYLKRYTAGIITKWQPYKDNTPLNFTKINQGFKESNFNPLYFINSNFNSKYYDFIYSLSYGGYSEKTNIGLAISKGRKKKIVIGTHHLEDILNIENAKSVSLYFNIQLQF